jgi:hypothetical protein
MRLVVISWFFFLGGEDDDEPLGLSLFFDFFPKVQKITMSQDFDSSLSLVFFL